MLYIIISLHSIKRDLYMFSDNTVFLIAIIVTPFIILGLNFLADMKQKGGNTDYCGNGGD